LYLATDALFQLFVLGEVVSNVISNFILLAAVFATSMLTEFMNLRAKKKALRIVEDDKEKYEAKWKTILSKDSQCIGDLATDLTNYFGHAVESESSTTVSVFQDCKDIDELYSRAEFINDAFQSLVSDLLESLQGAECTKQPRYSKCIYLKAFQPLLSATYIWIYTSLQTPLPNDFSNLIETICPIINNVHGNKCSTLKLLNSPFFNTVFQWSTKYKEMFGHNCIAYKFQSLIYMLLNIY
jgi:hypothetical protein